MATANNTIETRTNIIRRLMDEARIESEERAAGIRPADIYYTPIFKAAVLAFGQARAITLWHSIVRSEAGA